VLSSTQRSAGEALADLRTSDRLPWPDDELAATLVDSLRALELLVDLDDLDDDRLESLLALDDGSLAPLETVLRRCGHPIGEESR
jgi:hypothetical protein